MKNTIPKTINRYQLCALGFLEDRIKSTNPAEKPNPAIQLKLAAKNTAIPVSTACNRYNTGATNIKANSIGSVTPVKKLANPAADRKSTRLNSSHANISY